jgi:biopolymer transport protein ExbD
MSMDVGGAKGGVKSDINVTPLVDVMLVLLIIVMIIAPMLQKGVQVNLPLATNTVDKPDTADQTTVFVDAQGAFFVNAIKVPEIDVPTRVKSIIESKADKTVYLKGDTDARYGAIMKMMDALRKAQVDTVGLITERKQDEKKGGGH